MIDMNRKELTISRQCKLLELPRSSLYRELMRLIDEEYTRHPFFGTRQLKRYLKRRGYKVNRKHVQRLMRIMGIQSVAPKPGTSKPSKEHKIYPYLLNGLAITRSNQVWTT